MKLPGMGSASLKLSELGVSESGEALTIFPIDIF